MSDQLLLAFVFLVSGVAAVPIASRLGLGSVLGYLIAGIAISPLLALLHVDVIAIQHFAEFGVVMMLFLVGLELEPRILWSMRSRLLGLGGGQVAMTTLAVMAIAMLFGLPWSVALAIGMVLALSSTAIVLQTLGEKGLMKCDGGQSSFSVLLFQDIAVIPMLAFIPLLAIPELAEALQVPVGASQEGHGPGLSLVDGLPGWAASLVTLGAIGAVLLAGNYLTSPVFRFISAANLRELFVATALMMVIGIALLMMLVGLSPALGTFLAGMMLANSEYRHELESDIAPFKGLLLGLFFITVGAGINFGLLRDNLALTVGLTVGLILLKALTLYVLARMFRIGGSDRWLFSLGLAQAGEFGFVLLSFTVANGVLPKPIANQLLLVVALSMLATPLLFILHDRLSARFFKVEASREADAIDVDSHVLVAGHGRVGGIVSRILRGAGYQPTVIDFSSQQLEILKLYGVNAYFGDATRADLLHAAGIESAKLFVVAIDGRQQITQLTSYLLKNYPNLHVVARAVERDHVYDLWSAGCRDVVRDTYDSSLRMGRSAIEALGYKRETAQKIVDTFDEMDRTLLRNAADAYDPEISAHENETYTSSIRERLASWESEFVARVEAIVGSGKP